MQVSARFSRNSVGDNRQADVYRASGRRHPGLNSRAQFASTETVYFPTKRKIARPPHPDSGAATSEVPRLSTSMFLCLRGSATPRRR